MLFREFITESLPVFLLEYNREKTLETWGTKLEDRIKLETPVGRKPISAAYTLESIERSDPTPNKQYVQWLVKTYTNGSQLEDLISRGKDNLTKYELLKKKKLIKPEHADIGKFKLLKNLEDAMEQYELPEEEIKDKGDSSVIEDNKDFKAIIPHDKAAACYYGQGTRWCTAAKNNNMFKEYDKHGDLVILIPKNPTHVGEKYQLFSGDEDSDSNYMLMDEKDEKVTEAQLQRRFSSLNLVRLFARALSSPQLRDFQQQEIQKRLDNNKLTPQRALQVFWRHTYTKETRDTLEKIILKDPDTTTKYLDKMSHMRDRIRGREIPHVEEALLRQKNTEGIVVYSDTYIHRRWPEGEKILLENPNVKHICEYVDNVMKERWPEAEPLMINMYLKDVNEPNDHGYHLVQYLRRTIKNFWLEFEEAMLKLRDFETANRYRNTLGGDILKESPNYKAMSELALKRR